MQRIIGFKKTNSKMRALGGDSKTQDGINCHVGIIDEYHAHKDDTVKENLESSTVQRTQALIYHITTAGANVQSACKRYEESVIEVLEGRNIDNSEAAHEKRPGRQLSS
jgi:phage terminase large subunit-like protein